MLEFPYGGLIGLIILVLDIYAIVKVAQSGASTGMKVLWIVIILLLPVLGLILWALLGPQGLRHKTRPEKPEEARPCMQSTRNVSTTR